MKLDACTVVPRGWSLIKIDDVCQRVTSGGTPSRQIPQYYINGIWPWVKTQELQDLWIDDTEEHITDKAVKESSAKILPESTILLALYGATVGQLGLLRTPMACNQACCAMVVDPKKADYRFLYYHLLNARPLLKSLATGAAQQNLSGSMMKALAFPFPPLPEQRAIAHILGILDDKIELNRKTNKTLEAIARALFKSWFVDFEPVRAKAEGRETGLPPEIDKLFPDSFEDSEHGEVPKEWSVAPLPNLVDVNPTRQLSKGQIAPYLEMANVQTRGHRPLNWIMRPYGSGMKFMNGDTLMARITPCLEHGKTVYVDFLKSDEIGWGSTEFIVLRPKLHVPTSFGYYLARSENFRDYSISNMTGTSGRQRVPADCFGQFLLPVPPKAIFDKFGTLSTSILEAIKWNDMQSRTLASIRDALLPKLLSGEVRVENPELLLKEVM